MKVKKIALFQNPKVKPFLLDCYFAFIKVVTILLGDKNYLKLRYRLLFHKKLNLENPQSYNEKMNWLKVYYHNPLLTKLADKVSVKEYAEPIIGKDKIIKTYGVWDSFDSIDFNNLPDQFVMKTAHSNGHILICKDKSSIDFDFWRHDYKVALRRNLYYLFCEWPYKNIKPKLIAEQLLDDKSGEQMIDYKFMCFNGEPKLMYFTIKAKEIYENFYDMDFNPVDINHGFVRHQPEFERPENFDEMKENAAKLAKGIPFVRVDFYNVNNHIYLGEMTFFDWGGMKPFKNDDMDNYLGSLLTLPEKWI